MKYYLVDFTGSNYTLYAVLYASCLTLKPLDFGVHVGRVSWDQETISISGGRDPGIDRAAETFRRPGGALLSLSRDDLADLKITHGKLRDHISKAGGMPLSDELSLTIEQFLQLRRIDRSMPIRFLATFAILESMLTHQHSASSIGSQLRTKMKLLEPRFVHPIKYPGTVPSAKFWSAMYGHRSAIAHGNLSSVNNPPKLIGDREAALTLLESVVSRVMRAALDEPRLLKDLKEC